MKPLRLRLQAFGPYAKNAEVDFRELASGGLFLLHGQTGAGKTSILDGICFALYGKSSGAERSGEGMRSHLASAEEATEAQLEFALGNRIYRVVRTPRQELKKKRGTGTRSSEPTGDLFSLEGPAGDLSQLDLDAASWKPLAAGASKTTEQIIALLGMDEEQFRQVVVLPQGQFRKFLSSGSSEREKILETLFRTHRFRDLTDRLAQNARALEEDYKEKRKLLEGQLISLEVSNIEELETRLQELETLLNEMTESGGAIDEKHRIASQRLEQARRSSRLKTDLTQLESKSTELAAEQPLIEEMIRKLDADSRCRSALELDAAQEKLSTELKNLNADRERELAKLETTRKEFGALKERLEPLKAQEPEVQEAQHEIQALREQLTRAQKLLTLRQESQEDESKLKAAEESYRATERQLDETRARLKALDESSRAKQEEASRVDALASERQLLEKEKSEWLEALRLASEIQRFTQAKTTLEKEAATAELSVSGKKRSHLELKRDYHLSIAAHLAVELRDNEPCRVCGSTSHPHPAELPPNAPTQDDLEKSEERLLQEEKVLSELRTRLAKGESEIATRKTELARRLTGLPAHDDPTALIKEQCAKVEAKIKEKEFENQRALEARKQVAQLKTDAAAQEKAIIAAETSLKSLQIQREEALRAREGRTAAIAEIETSLPVDRRDPQKIIALGKFLREKIDLFQKELQDLNRRLEEAGHAIAASEARLQTMSDQIQRKSEEHAHGSADLETRWRDSGFTSLEECRKARLRSDESSEMQNRRRKHEQELAITENRLAETRRELLALPSDIVDLEQAEREFKEVDAERAKRSSEQGALRGKIEGLTGARKRLQNLGREIESLEAKYSILGRLASVAAGKPPHNLTGVNFPRFVLAAQLDEVLEQASRRLLVMSRGQFILRRVEGREDKRASAGLDLEVEDSFTGTARATPYLSGGEGFLASLALALGLADVVQSHLGGVRLDAVFVDEGFGTLDPEALELALKTLADLRAGGRIVGIISHVPELREQIPHRLVVRKTPEGSQVAWEA